MLAPLVGLLLGLTPAWELLDAGQAGPGPTVLVVRSPGVGEEAVLAITDALEAEGLDVWWVRFRPDAARTSTGAASAIALGELPGAVEELRRRKPGPVALVGEGFGGTLALVAAPVVKPAAVALLGAPLGPAPNELSRWLASRPLPSLVVDPTRPLDWKGRDVATLLWGRAAPLEPLPAPVAGEFLAWFNDGAPIDPGRVTCPVLATAGAMDRLAPPESVRPVADRLPAGSFVRFGMLRADLQDPGHADLLVGKYPVYVAKWVAGQLP